MKVLLLQPPIQDFYDTDIRLQPIGLAYLKATLRQHLPEIEVKIMDFHRGWGRRTLPVPPELNYLRDYYPYPDQSPFCAFHQYYHFGAPFELIAEHVAEEKPDLVGISSLFSPYYREVLATAGAIKARFKVPILVGGSHVSAEPHSILESPDVDYVIRGEGERPLVEFLRVWRATGDLAQIPNLGWKHGSALQLNPLAENYPIETIPSPDFGDFCPEDYQYEGKPLAFLVTSRSCPHRCSFCSVHNTFGLEYRRRSVDQVIAEMKLRYSEGYRVLDFEDDNLTFYREEMKELCRRILREFPRGDLQLLAMNGISYLSLYYDLLGLMRQAGFTHLNLALVSSDTTVRESTKRPHTVKKYLEVVATAVALGFKIVSYQILGLPQESLTSMIQTLVFAARLPVLLGASVFYLTPNSPIARQMAKVAGPREMFLARLTAMAIETEEFSRDDLYTLFLTTRILDFLKSLPLSARAEANFETLKDCACDDAALSDRQRLGWELLNRLFDTGVLYAATPQGLRPLTRFRKALFDKIWRQLTWVQTQSGAKIWLRARLGLPYKTTATSGCPLSAV